MIVSPKKNVFSQLSVTELHRYSCFQNHAMLIQKSMNRLKMGLPKKNKLQLSHHEKMPKRLFLYLRTLCVHTRKLKLENIWFLWAFGTFSDNNFKLSLHKVCEYVSHVVECAGYCNIRKQLKMSETCY